MSQTRELASAVTPAIPNFHVEIHPDREQVVLELGGELCLATAPAVDEQLRDPIEGGFQRIVLDLRRLTFMDSTGVRLLIETDARPRAGGLSFAIMIGAGQPQEVLELVGLSDRPARVGLEDPRVE